jgi:hypothetical protein
VREEQAEGNETLAAALEHAERIDLRDRLALLAAAAVAPDEPDVAPLPAPSQPPEPPVVVAAPAAPNGATADEAPAA